MGCAHKQNQHGFTLVEISIVMIIIGLLIGGTFGGMKLIENMQVNKTVQDLKAIESAALTFKDTYGRLPGDMPNTAARLPNCTVAPCATGGNGNRRVDPSGMSSIYSPITSADEQFTFWHHLQASDVVNLSVQNSTDMSFGTGQPEIPIGGGLRIAYRDFLVGVAPAGARPTTGNMLFSAASDSPSGGYGGTPIADCGQQIGRVDAKMDDGLPFTGLFTALSCAATPAALDSAYSVTARGYFLYDLKGF